MILALAACASGPRAAPPEPVASPQPPAEATTRVKRETQDPIELAILRLEGDAKLAATVNEALCKQAHEDDRVKLEGCANRELVDEQLMMNCSAPTAACMATIARALGATQILFGRVDAGGAVTLKLVDAETQIEKSWTGGVQEATHAGYDALVGKVR